MTSGVTLSGGGTVNVGASVTIASATTNTDDPGIYLCINTNSGGTANCTCTAGTGITRTANGTNSATMAINATTTISAIACDSGGTPWTASSVENATINTTLPAPVFDLSGGITYENTLTVHIVGPNGYTYPGGTTLCYTTQAGATPSCNGAACGNGLQTYGASIAVTATGSSYNAIACTAGGASPASGQVTYNLQATRAVVVNQNSTLACGASNITIGLDCGTAGGVCGSDTTAAQGPTTQPGAAPFDLTICYSSTATVTNCSAGTGITCFQPSSTGHAGATDSTTITTNGTTVSTATCIAGGSRTLATQTWTGAVTLPAAYSLTPNIDGDLADWTPTASLQLADCLTAACAAAGTNYGYFAFDTNNLYFAYKTSGFTTAATTFFTFYIGDGAAGGPTLGLIPADACPASMTVPVAMDAKYAITVESANNAVTAYQWNTGSSAWTTITATGVQANVSTTTGVPGLEVLVPKSTVGSFATPTVLGSVVTNAGSTNCAAGTHAATTDSWPQVATFGEDAHYLQLNTSSCLAPNTAANIH